MATTRLRWWPRLVAILLLLAATLVIVGVSIETAQPHADAGAASEHNESEEHGETTEGEGMQEGPGEKGLEGAKLLGIPLESPLFIGGLAAASIALAALVWLRPGRVSAALVIVFSIGAGIFDVSEIQHQGAEGATALLALATVVVALRVLAVVGGVAMLRDASDRTSATGTAA